MKPRVLQLIDSFNSGGSERQAVQLARLLHESGRFSVIVAALHDEGVLRAEVERLGLHDIVTFPLTSLYDGNARHQMRRFASYLRRENISVVHTHDFYTNIFGSVASALARVPVRIGARRESAVRSGKQRFAERMAYRFYHKVVANCDEVRRQLIEIEGLKPDKVVTLYNGLDMARVTPSADLQRDEVLASLGLPIDQDRSFVTIVANLRLEVKDHRTFLRAAREVYQRVPNANFVLAGEGPLTEPLRELARDLGIADNTHFIGSCERVADLLAVSDVCVLSSRAEGFSNSILEYMAASRPVVATKVGGAAEAIVEGSTGFLVAPGDHGAMAEKLASLLEKPEVAREMGRRGRKRVEEMFSSEAQLERTEKLYSTLLTKTSASRRPVRVLLVGPSLGILGGQAVQAARLEKHLSQEAGVEVGFLPVNPSLPSVLGALQKIKYVRTVITSLAYVASLLVRIPQYDVIHIFSASYFSFLLAPTPAILISKLFGRKTILNYRSGEADDHLRRWRRTAIPTMRLVDSIVTPSEYLVDVFAGHGLQAQYIYNIVDLNRFRFRRREPLSPTFLANRNFEPLYNVGCVVRAFALVQQQYPESRLTLVGDGSERRSLEQLVTDLKLENVEFLGRVSPDQMPQLYDDAEIYLNSPNIDNMPGSILEAFAAGTPVVSTDAGGIPYIVTDRKTGLLVSLDDHNAMAARVVELLSNEELARSIATAALRECERYRWETVRDQWLTLYAALAGRDALLIDEPSLRVSVTPEDPNCTRAS